MADRTPGQLGQLFVRHVVAKDHDGLKSLFTSDVDFVGLTPRRTWDARGPVELVDNVVFGAWFEPTDQIVDASNVEVGQIADRTHLTYRFLVNNPDGHWHVEQHCYFELTNGQVSWIRTLCSGFQPVVAPGD